MPILPTMGWKNGLRKDGKFWRYRFQWHGQTLQGTTKCETIRDAMAWLKQYQAQLAMGQVNLAKAPSLTLLYQEWQTTWAGKLSPSHLARAESAFRVHLLPLLGDLPADRISEDEVERVRSAYLSGCSSRLYSPKPRTPAGAQTLLGYLRAVLRWGGYSLTFKRIPPQQKQRPILGLGKVDRFMQHISAHGLHMQAMVGLMLYCGLREKEARLCKKSYIHGDWLIHQETKGKEALSLPIPPQLRQVLAVLGASGDSEWLCPARDGKPHRAGVTRKPVAQAGAMVGVPNLTPHGLRASLASILAANGVGAHMIQRMLRHKDIRTTLRYVQLQDRDLEAESARIWSTDSQPESVKTRISIASLADS